MGREREEGGGREELARGKEKEVGKKGRRWGRMIQTDRQIDRKREQIDKETDGKREQMCSARQKGQ